jgi:SRSO17 transposase
MDESWKSDLDRWLAPFLSAFRHKARARMCPVYVAGLIGAGDRKSVQPMAARDGEVGYDQLHHFIASGVWDAAPLEKALLAEADRMVGGAEAWLIVDDTALPKKGEHSVGVAPQYASSLGKTRQLPVAGLVDVGVARGSGDGGPAAIPARKLGQMIPSAWRGPVCRRIDRPL